MVLERENTIDPEEKRYKKKKKKGLMTVSKNVEPISIFTIYIEIQFYPGEGNGYPLQCCCLENSMDRSAWQIKVHGVAKSQTRLSDKHYTQLYNLDLIT